MVAWLARGTCMETWLSQFFLGLFILAVASRKLSFGGPSLVRSYTTAANYSFGLLAYFFSIGFIYFLVAVFIRRVALRDASMSLWFVLSPLLIVIALLVLIRFRPLSSLETWLRKKMYDRIGYPGHASRLTEVLVRSDYKWSGQLETEVRALLLGRGYDPDEKWLPVADPTRDLWFKAAILFHQIRNWESDRCYRRFLSNARVEFDVLRQRFDQLSFKVPRVFEMLERLGILLSTALPAAAGNSHANSAGSAVGSQGQETTEAVRTTISELLSDLQEDVAFFLWNISLFIARGVLSNTLTLRKCFQRLRELGFTVEMVEMPRPPAVIPLIVYIFFLIFLCISFPMNEPGVESEFPNLFRIVMIVTIQVIAFATAIYPKFEHRFANEDIYGRPPWAFIILAGLAAMGLAALVSLGFRYFAFMDWSTALHESYDNWPWLLMAFSTAAVSAFLIQDSRWVSTLSLRAKRMKDALVMGSINSATMVIVLWIRSEGIDDWWRPVVAFLFGLVTGYIVPSAFRGQGSTKLPAKQATGSP